MRPAMLLVTLAARTRARRADMRRAMKWPPCYANVIRHNAMPADAAAAADKRRAMVAAAAAFYDMLATIRAL